MARGQNTKKKFGRWSSFHGLCMVEIIQKEYGICKYRLPTKARAVVCSIFQIAMYRDAESALEQKVETGDRVFTCNLPTFQSLTLFVCLVGFRDLNNSVFYSGRLRLCLSSAFRTVSALYSTHHHGTWWLTQKLLLTAAAAVCNQL